MGPMASNSSPPSSGKFLPEESSTASHRLVADALAHLYEIQEEVEKVIHQVGSLQPNPHLRLDILNRLSTIKKKIRQFESYLGGY